MTFSEKKVVEHVKAHWVPAWESVAPVTESVYDLGDGRKVKGIVNGEIALFFCRPDGKAFDVLPALQSPAETLQAMKDALWLYERTGGARDVEALGKHHRVRAEKIRLKYGKSIAATSAGLEDRERRIGDAVTDATRDLRVAVAAKARVGESSSAHSVTIVEPGGKHYYKWRVHEAFGKRPPAPTPVANAPGLPHAEGLPLRLPSEWTKLVFEDILEMPLEGHSEIYDTSSIAPLMIVED